MSNSIIPKLFQDKEIFFDKIENELYLNATKTAKTFNKEVKYWLRSTEFKNYIEALDRQFPEVRNSHFGGYTVLRKGGNDKNNQGTWIHKSLIILFARWLSPDFAVWCDLQIEEILKSKNLKPIQTQTSQTLENIDLDLQISQNKKLLEFIELITSQTPKNLFFLDKIYKYFGVDSPLKLIQINLNSYYFIPTELADFLIKQLLKLIKF